MTSSYLQVPISQIIQVWNKIGIWEKILLFSVMLSDQCSDWSRVIMWPGSWPLMGRDVLCDVVWGMINALDQAASNRQFYGRRKHWRGFYLIRENGFAAVFTNTSKIEILGWNQINSRPGSKEQKQRKCFPLLFESTQG